MTTGIEELVVNDGNAPSLRELIPMWANVFPPDDVEVQLRDILPTWIVATAKLSEIVDTTEPLVVTPAPQASPKLTSVSKPREISPTGPIARKPITQPDLELPAWAANAAIKLAGLDAPEDSIQAARRPERPDMPAISWKNLASPPGPAVDQTAGGRSTRWPLSRSASRLPVSSQPQGQEEAWWKEQITLSMAETTPTSTMSTPEPPLPVAPRPPLESTLAAAKLADAATPTVRMIVEAALIEIGELDPNAPPPRLDPIPIPANQAAPQASDVEPPSHNELFVAEEPDRGSES
jgi:hypothetical protein